MTTTQLPQIIAITKVQRFDDQVHCPHCGAKGHVIYTYKTVDGQIGGAMGGCIKKFKMHPLALEMHKLLKKQDDYRNRDWNLSKLDQAILDTCLSFAEGKVTEKAAKLTVKRLNSDKLAIAKRRRF